MRQLKKLILIGFLGALFALPGYGQTTPPTASTSDQSDKAQVQVLKAQVDDLQAKLRLIGAALSLSGGAPTPATSPTETTTPVPHATSMAKADVQALQAQLADLTAKYQALADTVDKQSNQLAPIHDQLDQVNKAIQDVKSAPAPVAPASAIATAPAGTPTKDQANAIFMAETPDVLANSPAGISLNISWTLITGFLVMFMQAGFALVETGFTRAKNAAHTMAMNFMVYGLGMLGFWVSGFAIQYGGNGDPSSVTPVTTLGPAIAQVLNSEFGINIGGHYFGLFGEKGFFLSGTSYEAGIFTLFLFEMVFMDTTATIPTGAMAERWRFLPFCLFSVCVGAFIYPLFGNWVWGGGWLAALGKNFGLGHGHVDFAGSSVVHMTGGVLAFVGAKFLGPRIGKYNTDGSPNPIPGHNIPMAMLGTFILAFGWFGFNPGSSLASTDTHIGIIAVNTMLASASGAAAAMIICWVRIGKPDPAFMCNGMLAGLVAITAPCAFVDAWAAVLLGAIAGWFMYISVFFVEEKLKIDDPVGAISVHGVCGAWGVISLGLLANGKYGDGWNMVNGPVKGALLCGDWGQLVAECTGATTNIIAVGTMGWIVLMIIEKCFGGNRTTAEAELEGLDIPEMGTLGYNNDV